MKRFDVYVHPNHGLQAVKLGFSWPACFFTFLWAFFKQMWGVAFGILGVFLVLSLLEALFNHEGRAVGSFLIFTSQLAAFVIIGWKGNEWRRRNLERRGFRRFTHVYADTPDQAIDAAAHESPPGPNQDKSLA